MEVKKMGRDWSVALLDLHSMYVHAIGHYIEFVVLVVIIYRMLTP